MGNLLWDRRLGHTLGSRGRKFRLLFPDSDDVGVVPELGTSILARTDKRETRSTAISERTFEQVLGAGDTGDSNCAVCAGDDILEVLCLGDDRGVGLRLKGETGESDEGVLLVGQWAWVDFGYGICDGVVRSRSSVNAGVLLDMI